MEIIKYYNIDTATAKGILEKMDRSAYIVRKSFSTNGLILSYIVIKKNERRIKHTKIFIIDDKLKLDGNEAKFSEVNQLVRNVLGNTTNAANIDPYTFKNFTSLEMKLKSDHDTFKNFTSLEKKPKRDPIFVRITVKNMGNSYDKVLNKIFHDGLADYYKYKSLLDKHGINNYKSLLEFRPNDHDNIFGELYAILDKDDKVELDKIRSEFIKLPSSDMLSLAQMLATFYGKDKIEKYIQEMYERNIRFIEDLVSLKDGTFTDVLGMMGSSKKYKKFLDLDYVMISLDEI